MGVATGVMKKLFGVDDSLCEGDLNNLTYRNKFSTYLPWDAYDAENKMYINTDDTVGFMWHCTPVSFATDKTLSLDGLFRCGYPEGTVLQFILFADDYVDHYLDTYQRMKVRDNEVTKSAAKEYTDFLRKGKHGLKSMSGIPVRNFDLYVCVKFPRDKKDLNLQDLRSNTEEKLKGAYLFPRDVDLEGLLIFARRLLNDRTPENLSAYNESQEIRKQVILSETDIEAKVDKLMIGSKTLRCMTPKLYPQKVDFMQTNCLFGGIWGMVSDAEQITSPFMYSVSIVFENLKSPIHKRCNLILMQEAAGSFAPALRRRQEEHLWAADEIEKGKTFVRVIPTLWVWGDEQQSREALGRAMRIWESKGYLTQEEKRILPVLFLSSLPFGLYNKGKNIENIDRDFVAPAESVVVTLPVQADFAGGGKPVMLFTGRKGQICSLDLFDPGANNHNCYIAATSGSGKSFLVNYIMSNYYACNALGRIIDVGGSYKKMVKLYGAKYMDFNEKSDLRMNPFSNLARCSDQEDFNGLMATIYALITQMCYASTDIQPPDSAESEANLIKLAVNWAYQKEGPKADVDTVFAFLNEFPAHAEDAINRDVHSVNFTTMLTTLARKLAFQLREFTSNGVYGRWFNGEANFDISRDELVVLELESLKPRKELFKVVTLQLINAVTQDLYLSDRTRPRLVIFDEAWQFMREGALLKDVIEEGYRRARKYHGSFTIITQSPLDLLNAGSVGDVVHGNSAFKFYLESDQFDKAKEAKVIPYEGFALDYLSSLKSNKPNYSEVFMDTPFGLGIVRLSVDPFTYYQNSSSGPEIAEIDALVDGGLSYEAAIRVMIKKYRSAA